MMKRVGVDAPGGVRGVSPPVWVPTTVVEEVLPSWGRIVRAVVAGAVVAGAVVAGAEDGGRQPAAQAVGEG